MIQVTETALEKLITLMMEEGISPDTHNLRVGVAGGGCSGLQYEMDFDDQINEKDNIYDLESIKVVIDKRSLLYIAGTTLDYKGGLNGKGFEWVNPNASRECGCGASFAI